MDNTKLAELIKIHFTPLVFSCGCKGEDLDCAEALQDHAVWIQRDTVERIARYITELGETA